MFNIDTIVQESFAAGIDWRLMNLRYGARDRDHGYFHLYTGIFEDLLDVHTLYALRYAVGENFEKVQGLTTKQFETAVLESFSFDELRDKIKSRFPSGSSIGLSYTTADFDNLFAYWGGI